MKTNETISLVLNGSELIKAKVEYESGYMKMTLGDGRYFESYNTDAFECFVEIRKQIYPLLPKCKAAALNVYPSAMARQMSDGLSAYQFSLTKQAERKDLVYIFSDELIENLASPNDQLKFYEDWLDSLCFYDEQLFKIKLDEFMLDRFQGALFGLAVGDALGTSVEFLPRDTFPPVTDMVGGGVFELTAGQWTDDTSMALCLADSLISCRKFDAQDQMTRYLNWFENGYLSSTGRCFDIGNTVKDALLEFKKTGVAFAGSALSSSAGNGALMRLIAIPLFYMNTPELAINKAGESSKTTHGAQESIDCCKYFCALILAVLKGAKKNELFANKYIFDKFQLKATQNQVLKGIYTGEFVKKSRNEIKSSGYVVDTLEAALWCFYSSSSFQEGCLKAANLGNDADTVCAVYGQLAGAYYGAGNIPKHWLDKVYFSNLIKRFSRSLYRISLLHNQN
jgi:ADP-ribosyl-[dinitrogen reductase] hydrolase